MGMTPTGAALRVLQGNPARPLPYSSVRTDFRDIHICLLPLLLECRAFLHYEPESGHAASGQWTLSWMQPVLACLCAAAEWLWGKSALAGCCPIACPAPPSLPLYLEVVIC